MCSLLSNSNLIREPFGSPTTEELEMCCTINYLWYCACYNIHINGNKQMIHAEASSGVFPELWPPAHTPFKSCISRLSAALKTCEEFKSSWHICLVKKAASKVTLLLSICLFATMAEYCAQLSCISWESSKAKNGNRLLRRNSVHGCTHTNKHSLGVCTHPEQPEVCACPAFRFSK